MDKIALNAMDRHGFMTDRKFSGDSLNDLRSLYNRIKPGDTDYKDTVRSLAGFIKGDRLSVVNPTSKLIGVTDFPRRMADHKPSLDEIRNKAAYKLGLSQNRYSGYGGHLIPSKIDTNPALKDYMSRTKTASVDYEEMVKTAYEEIVEGIEKEAALRYSNVGGFNKNYNPPQKPNVSSSLVGAAADASRKLQSQSYISDMRAKERAGFTTKPRNTFWDDMF